MCLLNKTYLYTHWLKGLKVLEPDNCCLDGYVLQCMTKHSVIVDYF